MKSGQLWIVQLAEQISRHATKHISQWSSANKRHLGDQWQRSIDSIGANIVEGYGRQHLKDSLRFYSIAKGSLEESLFWLRRARDQQLISLQEAYTLSKLLIQLSRSIEKLAARNCAKDDGQL